MMMMIEMRLTNTGFLNFVESICLLPLQMTSIHNSFFFSCYVDDAIPHNVFIFFPVIFTQKIFLFFLFFHFLFFPIHNFLLLLERINIFFFFSSFIFITSIQLRKRYEFFLRHSLYVFYALSQSLFSIST